MVTCKINHFYTFCNHAIFTLRMVVKSIIVVLVALTVCLRDIEGFRYS